MDWFNRIADWALVAPDRPAHVSEGRVLTYGALVHQARSLAAALTSTLPDDRSPIAIVGHKEPEILVGFLGAALARHPYVPIDDGTPAARGQRIRERAHVSTTLTTRDVATLVRSHAPAPWRTPDPADTCYIMFTSGSTGEPNGVMIPWACLTSFVTWLNGEQGFAEQQEVFLNQAVFSFDLSVMDLYPSLSTGGTLVSLTRNDIADFSRLYRTLSAADLTVWVSTPSFARLCLAEPTFGASMLPRLRRFLFCGETLTPEDARQLLTRFPDASVWNTYGPTEATVATTSIRVTHDVLARHSVLPVGRTKPGTTIRITADGSLDALPDGDAGEIVIAGDNVSPGYVGDPVLTCRKFQRMDGMPAYRTGDLGRMEDGLLFFHGRRDDQIKLRGHRIELGDVEASLCAIQGVSAAVVLPMTRNGAVDALAAFVIASGRADEPEPARLRWLRGEVQRHLPRYMHPRTMHFVDRFPMTANGKIDRRELLARL